MQGLGFRFGSLGFRSLGRRVWVEEFRAYG